MMTAVAHFIVEVSDEPEISAKIVSKGLTEAVSTIVKLKEDSNEKRAEKPNRPAS